MAQAKTIAMSEPAEEKVIDHPAKGQRKIHPTRFKEAAGDRNIWSVVPEHGTDFEALLKPEYWAHVAKSMRPTDRIEVNAEDGSYFAEFIVVACGDNSAKVTLLRKHDLETEGNAQEATAFEVVWRGPHHKYAVIRLSDKEAVQTGFATKSDGLQWLATNLKSLTK